MGKETTALINAITVLAEKGTKFVPEILVMGGGDGGGSIDGVAATLMKFLRGKAAQDAMAEKTK
jgi:hypothetical protein